jgi:hypothetical protein
MVIVLVYENGKKKIFDASVPLRVILSHIQNNDIETIVVGETSADAEKWEKQFKAVTVMPSGFGKEG